MWPKEEMRAVISWLAFMLFYLREKREKNTTIEGERLSRGENDSC